ncbi:MAG: hypothetical protein EXR73_04180 [Myxococcales bacterium]|nr:hypothetical protein [Myxococcales bacterium]
MRRTSLLCLSLIALLFAGTAAAQPGPPPPPDPAVRAAVRQKVRILRNARLIEVLELDEPAALKLFPVLNKYDDQLGVIAAENGSARRELRRLHKEGKLDDAAANRITDMIVAIRARIHKLEDERLVALRKVVKPTQLARLMVVLPEVDHAIERAIRKTLRKEHGPGRGGPGRRGPGHGAQGEGFDLDEAP